MHSNQQDAETQKIKNKTKVDKAKADAEAKKIEAEGEAAANKKIQDSLTDNIIKQQYIEKWDGKLPTVSSSKDQLLIDIK